ncbi:MAG: hypothetical protein J5449_02095 [Oscillospiraceae bacterium]|nr:hypothetical protein [Oscillospiraceae bacterium]
MRRLRRLFCFVFALLMLVSVAPERGRAADTVIFTAANEKIYPLSDETMPFWSGGTIYVPQDVLVDNDFNIRYNRNRERNTVVLYQMRIGLIFDLSSGTAETQDSQIFPAPVFVRGDHVFFPLDVLCRFFGLEYSYTRVTYGYLLRIKNSSVSLSDPVFIDAAGSSMTQRYMQYERSKQPSPAEPDPSEQTPVEQEPAERTIYLAVESTAATPSEQVLFRFSAANAAILFTPESLSGADDLLRRLASGGGTAALRIDASGGAEETLRRIEDANYVIWTVSNTKTRLVLLSGADEETSRAVEDAGYCLLHFEQDYSGGYPSVSRMCSRIFSAADRNGGSCRVLLGADTAALGVLSSLLTELSEGNCTQLRLNETVA